MLITDLWLLLKEKVAAASLHVWLSNSDDTAVKCCAPYSVQWETERAACVCHLQRAVQRKSRRDLLRVDESARKLLTYSTRSVILWCIVHQWKSSAGSATCLCVIKNNKTWGSRHCCIMQKERALGFALTIWGRLAEATIRKKHPKPRSSPPPAATHTNTHSGKFESFEKNVL